MTKLALLYRAEIWAKPLKKEMYWKLAQVREEVCKRRCTVSEPLILVIAIASCTLLSREHKAIIKEENEKSAKRLQQKGREAKFLWDGRHLRKKSLKESELQGSF